MEKDRSTKLMVIIALLVGVVGLSIGFATFSTMITIKSSAKVTPSRDAFTTELSPDPDKPGGETPDPVPPETGPSDDDEVEATPGEIDNSDIHNPVIKNLHVTFTKPGQSATWTVYAHNSGQYLAYLKSITFNNVTGKSSPKICTGAAGTTDQLVQDACQGIQLSVKAGNDSAVTATKTNITNHTLVKGGSEPIVIKIEYLAGSAWADGDFDVSLGDVVLEYRTAD